MPDDLTPAPAPDTKAESPTPAQAPAPTPETKPAAEPDAPKPNPVKELRDALDAAKAAQKAAEAKVKEMEREKLSEVERLKAENDELKPLRDEHGKFESALKRIYESELATVPEEKRPLVESLSKSGTWDERLDALEAAKALLPAPAAAAAEPAKPAPAGTVTNPAQRKGADAPMTYDRIKSMSVAEVQANEAEIYKFLESQNTTFKR